MDGEGCRWLADRLFILYTEYTTTQYISYVQSTRLSVIHDDITFQLEGIQHPDTIQDRHIEIQDLETRVNRMRLEIPHDIRRTLHDTSNVTPYVVDGHLFFTRQYPPSTSLVNPPPIHMNTPYSIVTSMNITHYKPSSRISGNITILLALVDFWIITW